MGLLLPLVSDGRKCRKLNTDKKSDILLPKLHYLTEVDYVPKTGHLPEVDYRSEVNYEVPAGCLGASATHVNRDRSMWYSIRHVFIEPNRTWVPVTVFTVMSAGGTRVS